jgi:hypothetical protein
MSKRQIAAALATALAIPAVLTGCAGVSDNSIRQTLSSAIVSEVPHATYAMIGFDYDGLPTNRGVGIKVYLDRATDSDVTTAVDKVLEIAWTKFPVEPVRVSVSVVDGPHQPDDSFSDLKGVDLNDAAAALGFGSSDYGQLTVQRKYLEEHYGPWKKATG